MVFALIILFFLSIGCGYYGFREREDQRFKQPAKISFFVVWSLFTVILTLVIFKEVLKPSVEVKFNTRSWNEIMQQEK